MWFVLVCVACSTQLMGTVPGSDYFLLIAVYVVTLDRGMSVCVCVEWGLSRCNRLYYTPTQTIPGVKPG